MSWIGDLSVEVSRPIGPFDAAVGVAQWSHALSEGVMSKYRARNSRILMYVIYTFKLLGMLVFYVVN